MRLKNNLPALAISTISLCLYLLFPSARYHPDGLRVLPALHRAKTASDTLTIYLPRPWHTGYQPTQFFRQNLQKHLLFPLYAHTAYHTARLFGYPGSGLKPLQIANAIGAAITVFLFVVILINRRTPTKTAIFSAVALSLSHAFIATATNITEVAPALPFLLLGIFLLDKNKPCAAGISLGISAGFYLLSLVMALGIALVLIYRQRLRIALTAFISALLTTGSIYIGILLLAGYRNPEEIYQLLFFLPEQGTFGGFKPSHLVSLPLGFLNSLIPVLPENFAGIRQAISSGGTAILALVVSIIIGAIGILLFFIIFILRSKDNPWGVAIFLATLICGLFWDPYHQKIWTYAIIGTFSVIPTALSTRRHFQPVLLLLLVPLFLFNSIRLIQNNRPDPGWHAARKIARFLTTQTPAEKSGLLFGNWEPEFGYLPLLYPDSLLVPIPDLILETRRDTARFRARFDSLITSFRIQSGNVYFLNMLNRTEKQLKMFYSDRLKFPYFINYLATIKPAIVKVWEDTLTNNTIYRLK